MRRPGPPGSGLGVGLTTPACTTFLVENHQMMLAGEDIRRRTSEYNGLCRKSPKKSKCKRLENESTREVGVEKHRSGGPGLKGLWYLRRRIRAT
jgi:hypothetical protein